MNEKIRARSLTCSWIDSVWSTTSSQPVGGLAYSGNALVLNNEVALRQARLVPAWVKHLSAKPATPVYSAWLFLHG